jgi:PAS domain S-box-containing protein
MQSRFYRRTTQHPLWIALHRAFSTPLERPVTRYAAGLAIFFLALALRLAILPITGGIPFLTFYPAVTLAALLCGTGPAMMVIVLGCLAGNYFFMGPYYTITCTPGAIAAMAVFTLSGLLICMIVRRNRKEEAAQALLAAIVISSQSAIISKTIKGVITSWNPAAEQLFGYPATEAIGKPVTILIPPDKHGEEEKLMACIARGETVSQYETKRLRKDGSIIEVSVDLAPVHDRMGRIVGASKIVNDITECKAQEAAQVLLASIVASSGDAIISKSMQGTITSWNPAAERMFGYTAEEILGKPANTLYPPDRLYEEEGLYSQSAKGESITQFETVRRHKDGSLIMLSSSLSPLLDRSGHTTGVSVIAHDITERKAMEEAMRRANQRVSAAMAALKRSNTELDEFARVAAHDLKEPLRGINNYASFLLEDYAGLLDEQGKNYLASMQRLATRMGALIDCLLDYSRLGSAPLAMEEVNMEAVLGEVAEDLKQFLIDHKVELRRPVRLPMATGNLIRLGELLQNLIANGAKYNDKQKKWVEVGCDISKETPVYSVSDNGIGIPEQHLESVFGIFKRLHAQSKYGGGTGAGLTVAKKIVERHGGRIWLESTPNRGTTFHFTLATGLPVDSVANGGS